MSFAESSTVNSSSNSSPRWHTHLRVHEPGLRFTVENGFIRPQTRLRSIRKIKADGYIVGMDVQGFFYPIYKDGHPVEVLEANNHITRPLNRDDLHVQFRSVVRPPPSEGINLHNNQPEVAKPSD